MGKLARILSPTVQDFLTDRTAETSEQGDSGHRTRGDRGGPQQPRKTLFRRGVGAGPGRVAWGEATPTVL